MEILTENGAVSGVVTHTGATYAVKAAVVATGTYLGGRIVVGEVVRDSGPDGLSAALPLTQSLLKLGLSIRRFKTGTPPSPELNRLLEERGEPPVKDGARLSDLLRRPRLTYADLTPFDPQRPQLPAKVVSEAEITIKYAGYIDRQLRQVEEVKRLEERPLPPDLDYQSISCLLYTSDAADE